jgi:hypothetical protein
MQLSDRTVRGTSLEFQGVKGENPRWSARENSQPRGVAEKLGLRPPVLAIWQRAALFSSFLGSDLAADIF